MIKIKKLIRKVSKSMRASDLVNALSRIGYTLPMKSLIKTKPKNFVTHKNKMKFLVPLNKEEWLDISISYHKYFVNHENLVVIFANNKGKMVLNTVQLKRRNVTYRTKFIPKYFKGNHEHIKKEEV
jgi:hypothetical protein